ANALQPGDATSLLLDSITLSPGMVGELSYNVRVIGQFASEEDVFDVWLNRQVAPPYGRVQRR
ncbi:MAG: hypothetical protein FWE25_05605, partial [Lachnospiraceae bacterium]|nr:hypothetical protein [Lachnospiraceae bacterium]